MKLIIKTLQNPYIKMFMSPLATILFGLIVGVSHTSSIQWLTMVLLALITISASLITHLFYIRYDKLDTQASPQILLYIFEAILFISSVIFLFNSHWIVNLLLIFYLIFIHIQYMPYKMTGTIYHIILSVFFNGFILNIIAYNSQTHTVTSNILLSLIPIVLMFLALTLQEMSLKKVIMNYGSSNSSSNYHYIILALCVGALLTGFYFSLPSQSYFLVQILFFLISGLTMLPLIVPTPQTHQAQNKMNYANAITFIFTLLYSLSYLF